MTKKEMDYSKSIIYKICCNDISITDCYVGSTTNLVQRRRDHKSICSNEKNKKYNINVYKFIRDNGSWDNWSVVLVQEYPECKCREELLKFERHHMELLGATLNKSIPGRTGKEYRQDNKERIAEYHQNNKERIAEKSREYRQNNKEKLNEGSREYYQDNKERIAEYYQENKETINEVRKEKVECEFCKSLVRKSHIRRHQNSLKCLAEQNK